MQRYFAFLAVLFFASPAHADTQRPNFVVVLCDDLGYGELGCYGSKIAKTPHLDGFARQGLRLTHCYSGHPNCSPARAALLTGRIPYLVGIHNWIPLGSPMHLKANHTTIASLLRQAGYATCLVGKWHLSGALDDADQPTPGAHGFDHWFATQNVAVPSHRDPENFFRNGKALGKLSGYSAPLVAEEAADWLAHKRDASKPFFLFMSLHEPHEKIATDPHFLKLYPTAPEDPSMAEFWGNVSQLDDAFGRLMKTLDDLKLADDTLVFFTSDNGAALTAAHPHGSTGGLRGKKSQIYEGGVRVPGLLRWPRKIRANSESKAPVSGIDVLPTFCELAKIAPSGLRTEGASFVPVFEGKEVVRATPLYWHFHRADSVHKVAMRLGDWKLYATLTGPQLNSSGDILREDHDSLHNAELGAFALYDLGKDPGETTDVAAKEPARTREIAREMDARFRAVQAGTPRWPPWLRFPAQAEKAMKASRASAALYLADAKRQDGVRGLNLTFTNASDADLKDIAAFKSLERLALSGTDVSDAGLASIAGLPELKSVDLRNTNVSKSGVDALRKMRPRLNIQH